MLQDVFEIYDGRNSFWQWDTGQKLIVLNDEIDQVHFSNRDMTYAIIKEVHVDSDGTRICDIPDVVLQSSGLLMAYAYVMGNDYNKTICAVKFAVSSRPVPEDYVYEEDDRFLDLVEKIEAIEDLIEDVSKFQKFNSLEEATKWAETANESGLIVTVNVDSKWVAYVVEEDNTIIPVCKPVYEASHYEGIRQNNETDTDVINRVLVNVELHASDVFVVKTLICDDKYSYTAYVYDGVNWTAMDGNYSADNVYFDRDILITKEIGYITLTNGQGHIPSKGKNLTEVFDAMFAEENNPQTMQPSVGWDSVTTGSYEVGTVVTPKWDAKFDTGSYSYGPETGVSVTSWSITNNITNENFKKESGAFANWTVTDESTYKITAKANHTEGTIPVTNKGNQYVDGKIASGQKSVTSSGISGYRSYFYGVLDTGSEDVPLTSAIIRGKLTNGGNYNAKKTFTLNSNENIKRIVIAIPSSSTRSGLSEVILTSAMNTPITSAYVKTAKAIKVAGANNATSVNYDIWVYEPSKIDAGEIHQITLA